MSENTEVVVGMSDNTRTEANPVIEQEAGFILIKQGDPPPEFESGPGEEPYHLWFRGTHYISAGEADEVSTGDVFLQLTPNYSIEKITEINVEPPEKTQDDNQWVKVDLWGPETNSKGSQKLTTEQFTGIENPAMGYAGPPIKFEPASE